MRALEDFGDLCDGEIKLELKNIDEPDSVKGNSLRYGFSIIRVKDNEDMGVVYFVVEFSRKQYLRGHLSYGISAEYRGNNYAMKACKIVKKLALQHGFSRLFIGSHFDNIASIKTIEKLGALPISARDVPDDEIFLQLQEDGICMYVWHICEINDHMEEKHEI